MTTSKWVNPLTIAIFCNLSLYCGAIKADQNNSNSENIKNIEFPSSYDYPMAKGPGYETMLQCQMCHSFGYILNQGNQTRSFWEYTTHKMVAIYKAPITPEDEIIIVNYLVTNFGKD